MSKGTGKVIMKAYLSAKTRRAVIALLTLCLFLFTSACSSKKLTPDNGETPTSAVADNKADDKSQTGEKTPVSAPDKNEATNTSESSGDINGTDDNAQGSDTVQPGSDDQSSDTSGSDTAQPGSDDRNNDSIIGNGDSFGDEVYEGTDEYEGYVGTVEVEDADCPLFEYDGICYCIVGDHAEVLYTFLSDDTLESTVIRSEIVNEGVSYPVTAIQEFAFYYFDSLTSVTLPEKLEYIGTSAFEFCEFIESIEIPAGVKTIDSYAFSECAGLKEIVLPDSVTTLGEGVFFNCTSLKSVVLPGGLTSIPESFFSGCETLETVVLPAELTAIGEEAFWYCENIESIELPESLTVIGDRAFYDCISLKELKLPKALVMLSEDALDACDSLEKVYASASQIAAFSNIFDGYDFEIVEQE